DRPSAPVRRSSRRTAADPRDAARRRWLTVAAAVAIAGVAVAGYVVTTGRPPDGPVAELTRFGAAMEGRDVDAMLALWDPGEDLAAARAEVEQLFATFGGPGPSADLEPPRVRILGDLLWRGIHRMGEVDLE